MKLQSNLKLEQDLNYTPRRIMSPTLIVLLCILGIGVAVLIYVHLIHIPYLIDNSEEWDWDNHNDELYLDGDGTIDKPYLLKTPECLEELAQKVNMGSRYFHSYFLVANNIDMSGREWYGIGMHGRPFSGSFDGGGHTISGLRVFNLGSADAGLFRSLRNADIKNLNIDAVITGYGSVGVLAGVVEGGRIDNCTVSGRVKGEGESASAGGLAGSIIDGVISNSSSSVTVTSSYTAGGFIGRKHDGTISGCFATGDVSAYSDDDYDRVSQVNIGGFVGEMSNGVIKTSYATGDVRINDDVYSVIGGFAGLMYPGAVIENCYAEGNVTVDWDEFDAGAFAGRLNRRDDNPGTIRNSYAVAKGFFFVGRRFGEVENSYSAFEIEYGDAVFIGWDFNNVWYMSENGLPKLRAFLN
jgi:hypothetical protein